VVGFIHHYKQVRAQTSQLTLSLEIEKNIYDKVYKDFPLKAQALIQAFR